MRSPAAATAQDADKAIRLKGQVVCSLCWFEADRKTTPYGTEGDLKCAVACSKSGVPAALAVMGGREATLYRLEYGTFEKVGKGWLEYIGKYVEATGVVYEQDGKRYLQVNAAVSLLFQMADPAGYPQCLFFPRTAVSRWRISRVSHSGAFSATSSNAVRFVQLPMAVHTFVPARGRHLRTAFRHRARASANRPSARPSR